MIKGPSKNLKALENPSIIMSIVQLVNPMSVIAVMFLAEEWTNDSHSSEDPFE
jgi:hypothetical protein